MPFTYVVILLNALFWIVLHFCMGIFVRIIPKSWTSCERILFKQRGFEEKLYVRIRLKDWKDMLPEAGFLAGFPKRNLVSLKPAYLDKFIRETCLAELAHLLIAVLGYASVLFVFMFENPSQKIYIFVLVATIDVFVQLPFIIVQRYNRPRLIELKQRLEMREALTAAK